MREETVARSYAETLLALAEDHGAAEEYASVVELTARLLDESPDFRLFLETPRIDAGPKKEALRHAFEGRVPKPFLHFLLVVVDKRRQRLLRRIATEYRMLLDDRLGRTHAEVSVAHPMDEATRTGVEEALGRVLGRSVVAHERVRPELLGGLVVRSGDRVWDGSLRRRLEEMRRSLLHVALPELPAAPSEPQG